MSNEPYEVPSPMFPAMESTEQLKAIMYQRGWDEGRAALLRELRVRYDSVFNYLRTTSAQKETDEPSADNQTRIPDSDTTTPGGLV